MDPVIFDGKSLAKEKEKTLKAEVAKLKKRKVTPKLTSILVGDDNASKLFLSLKKSAAERVGAVVEIKKFKEDVKTKDIISLIESLNKDKKVHGIMIQLPLPQSLAKNAEKIIYSIDAKKDVDGMREDGHFLTPTVKAVIETIKEASEVHPFSQSVKVVVIGSKGFVGKRLVSVLKEMGYEVKGVDVEEKNLSKVTKTADILISATGRQGLIKKNMIKGQSVVIDVGAPKGDVRKEVLEKVSFLSPVPGGVGPVTIASLLENLVSAAQKR